MKIEYIRNVQFGYMRVEIENPLMKTEQEMLERNQPEGILPVLQQKENNKYLLRYDITGKQSLDVLLEGTMADITILKSLLVGICVAVKQLEKYLLCQEGILLMPETIFWDGRTETIYFCYYPESEQALQVRFMHLMEYILARTNHKNVQAVKLAYDIYEMAQNPCFCIKDVQDYFLNIESDVQADGAKKDEEETEGIELKREKVPEATYEDLCNRQWNSNLKKVVDWINENIRKLWKKKQENYIVDFEVKETSGVWMETQILSEIEDKVAGILKYEGGNGLPDIVITKNPFMIGSAKECDGIINYPTISRCHTKITNSDGIYFIEDLNSTNGTQVNGKMLCYKTKVSLKKNDSICFANESYRLL